MGQAGSSELIITEVDIETSVRDSTAYARSIGLSGRDCFFLQWAGYDGGALLTARDHQLRNDGISASGAARLIRSLKAPVRKVFIDVNVDEDAEAFSQLFTFKHQQDFHEQMMRSGASALRQHVNDAPDVNDAPLYVHTDVRTLEEGGHYNFVYSKGSMWARVQGGLKTTNAFCDKMASVFEKDAEAALKFELDARHGETCVQQFLPAKFKTPSGSLPDGVFLLTTMEGKKTVYLLEAKYDADTEFTKADEQLTGYVQAAKKQTGCNGASFVKVLAHAGVKDLTRRKAKSKQIELFRRVGDQFQCDEGSSPGFGRAG